jgi:protein transport protein SEC61 subunit gamma-like protein
MTKKEKAAPVELTGAAATLEPLRKFALDSYRLVKRCTKPDAKEFGEIAFATTVGFLIMGFVGYFVKLIHIPINHIIVGSN